jgi:hypothetical protein
MPENNTLIDSIEQQIRSAVDRSMASYVEKVIDELTLDQSWLTKIETLVNQSFMRKFDQSISMLDFDSLVTKHIDLGFQRWKDRLFENFSTHGIVDSATANVLTVSDSGITVTHDVDTDSCNVRQDARVNGTLTVNNLAVLGDVNVDNRSWDSLATAIAEQTLKEIQGEWTTKLVQEVLELSKISGIEFESVKIKGQTLVDGDRLCDTVQRTNIKEVGALKELTVLGETTIYDTVNVSNKRVGINTDRPDMALSVWDEEITISIGKLSAKQGYVGTSRLQNLSIGVNRTGHIEIDTDGLVTIGKLRIGRHCISHADQVPGYAGTKGDIVFNSDPKEHAPFAWVCLGNYRWHPVKGA